MKAFSDIGAKEEYVSLRQELYTIIQARYNILTACIALIGVTIGITFTNVQQELTTFIPILLAMIFIPALTINYYMTVHFSRLSCYIYVRFEEESKELFFEKALHIFRKAIKKPYKAYTKPISITYLTLYILSNIVSFIAGYLTIAENNIPSFFTLINETFFNSRLPNILLFVIFYFVELIIPLISILVIIYKTNNVRRNDTCYKIELKAALENVGHKSKKVKDTYVFLDRDGVINKNLKDHVKCLNEFKFLPYAIDSIVKLSNANFGVVIVSNQPIIEEKLSTENELNIIHNFIRKEVAAAGGQIDLIKYCPHSEKFTECNCRKPKIGLLTQASTEIGFSLDNAFLIGDQITDIEAGKNAGCTTILIKTGLGTKTLDEKEKWKVTPEYIKENIMEAVDLIIDLQNSTAKINS